MYRSINGTAALFDFRTLIFFRKFASASQFASITIRLRVRKNLEEGSDTTKRQRPK
jgi:hypothetical protein